MPSDPRIAPAGPAAGAPPILPVPSQNEVDAVGTISAASIAKQIFDGHTAGMSSLRARQLVWEKLLLHVDGTGDYQWADIFNGAKVEIPQYISEFRKTENLLRPIVDNSVAHHATMPLVYFADSPRDVRARERAIVDVVWANYLAQVQDFNGLFTDALYLAMVAGFCPVHRYWRDDQPEDWYEPVGQNGDMQAPAPGMIDCWVGNPFDTVFDRSAKKRSVRWMSYARVLPADAVRAAFGHVPGVEGLQGTTRLPSAAEFQIIARSWQLAGLGIHGDSTMTDRRGDKEELLTVICREVAPGGTPDYPEGRLQVVVVPGHVDSRSGRGNAGHALLVADQPLPGSDYSSTNFYSHHRYSDIYGKPWVEDLDQLQVDLNIALSKRWEFINKGIESPIIVPGGAIGEDMQEMGGYNLLEVEPSLAGWRPQTIEWPMWIMQALDKEIGEKRQALYTIGGYQAVSRGESLGSRTPFKAIQALQQADSRVHNPVNARFRRSATDFMRGCWRQMKEYGTIPWLVDIVGDEFAHLVEPYIDAAKLSDRAPNYRLINSFGPDPEIHAEEVRALVQLRGADGMPFLRTDEARRNYPNQLLFNNAAEPQVLQRRRAREVARAILQGAKRFREQSGMDESDPQHPWVQQAGMQLFYEMEQQYKRRRDDDLQGHIDALTEVTQDEMADPIARHAAELRQNLYYDWQAMMAGVAPAQPAAQSAVMGQPAQAPMQAAQSMGGEPMGGEPMM
jgi:hypothetical protein